jgi:hypothetical protein
MSWIPVTRGMDVICAYFVPSDSNFLHYVAIIGGMLQQNNPKLKMI